MQTEKIHFTGSQGDRLAARLDRPGGGEPRAWALFAHCFTCTKNLKAVGRINEALTDHGIGVLRFDFTGLGESEGDFADTDFSSNVEDLVAAAEYMEKEAGAPTLLIGHSLGGAAVLRAAGEIAAVRAVATIAAPFRPDHVARLIGSSREEIEREGVAEVQLGGRSFKIRRHFLEDLEAARPERYLSSLDRALLILHAPLDQTVGIDNAADIFTAAKHPKSFVSLHGADHLLSDSEDARYAGRMIAAWAERYLEE